MGGRTGVAMRNCDIVMKGGITSGVVYPLAAVELSKDHHFRNIGGTSAGAIAAAAVAAAEFGRRSGSNEDAYAGIAELPKWLGKRLISLFQPSSRMKPLFDVLLVWVGHGIRPKIVAPLKAFSIAAAAGALPGLVLLVLALALDGGLVLRAVAGVFASFAMLAGALAAVVVSAALRFRELPDNYYGLCPGNDRGEGAASPPLTRWLADLIDDLAGRKGDAPLTFGDLWALDGLAGERGVNLQMMMTNLSQNRPYSLPFEGGEEFWFDPEEFLDLFPRRIVDHMVEMAGPAIDSATGGKLHPLPPAASMPIVVAARMSLSFPVLISAIPLYAINDAPKLPSPVPERCWFSDGGITSNFPVHFFDAPIPRWPTFAIDLMQLSPDRSLDEDESKNVWLPRTNEEGVAEAWIGWEDDSGFKRLFGFANSIFRTAQNWIDNRQMRGAGYRDRIAHVRLEKGEGGMNLAMEDKKVERLAERGAWAARELAERFSPTPPPGTKLDWDNQKWIRYRVYLELLERQGEKALRGYRDTTLGTPLADLAGGPPDFAWEAGAQSEFAQPAVEAQLSIFETWQEDGQGFAPGSPQPAPEPWLIPRL
jgi:predicted acylesterase/phospholipase RssA